MIKIIILSLILFWQMITVPYSQAQSVSVKIDSENFISANRQEIQNLCKGDLDPYGRYRYYSGHVWTITIKAAVNKPEVLTANLCHSSYESEFRQAIQKIEFNVYTTKPVLISENCTTDIGGTTNCIKQYKTACFFTTIYAIAPPEGGAMVDWYNAEVALKCPSELD